MERAEGRQGREHRNWRRNKKSKRGACGVHAGTRHQRAALGRVWPPRHAAPTVPLGSGSNSFDRIVLGVGDGEGEGEGELGADAGKRG